MLRHLLWTALLWPSLAAAQTYVGPADVVDGDSLSVSGFSVRLFGIDAPEGKQSCNRGGTSWHCGEEAATQLRNMIGGNPVECRGRGIDSFGRTVAVCTVDGIELNRAMVEAGWATAFRKYAQDYVTAEARAKAARRGIWDSEFDLPENFRAAAQRLEPAAPQPFARRVVPSEEAVPSYSGCAIKGNRNRKGQWIYHLPGMPYYDVTRAEEMFCTEAQAREAGYRRAMVR